MAGLLRFSLIRKPILARGLPGEHDSQKESHGLAAPRFATFMSGKVLDSTGFGLSGGRGRGIGPWNSHKNARLWIVATKSGIAHAAESQNPLLRT